MKPSYFPSTIKRIRKCGFGARMATRGGRKVLSACRAQGRYKICERAFVK